MLAVVHGAEVVVDRAAALRVKKNSPAPKSFQPEAAPAAASDAAAVASLEQALVRATMFYKLLSLVNGKSGVRLAVVESLAALLNAGAVPALPAADNDAASLAALAAFLQGVGSAVAADGTQQQASDALAAAGIQSPPGLSAAERAVMQDGQCVAAGTAAICCHAGKLLLATANAVAALSAEALQADVSILSLALVLCAACAFRQAQHGMLWRWSTCLADSLCCAPTPRCFSCWVEVSRSRMHTHTLSAPATCAAGQGPRCRSCGIAAAQGCAAGW